MCNNLHRRARPPVGGSLPVHHYLLEEAASLFQLCGHYSQAKCRTEGENDTFSGISLKFRLQSVRFKLFRRDLFKGRPQTFGPRRARGSFHVKSTPFTVLQIFRTTMKSFRMTRMDGEIIVMLSLHTADSTNLLHNCDIYIRLIRHKIYVL